MNNCARKYYIVLVIISALCVIHSSEIAEMLLGEQEKSPNYFHLSVGT